MMRISTDSVAGAICRGLLSNFDQPTASKRATELCELLDDLAACRMMDYAQFSPCGVGIARAQAQNDANLLHALCSAMEDAYMRTYPQEKPVPEAPEMIS